MLYLMQEMRRKRRWVVATFSYGWWLSDLMRMFCGKLRNLNIFLFCLMHMQGGPVVILWFSLPLSLSQKLLGRWEGIAIQQILFYYFVFTNFWPFLVNSSHYVKHKPKHWGGFYSIKFKVILPTPLYLWVFFDPYCQWL